jgi:hypothetical protein
MTSSSVSTYSTQSIGAADASRIVYVLVATSAATTIDSATLDYGSGDTAMTSVCSATVSGANIKFKIFSLAAPSGTTATIKITFSGFTSASEQQISVYSVVNGTQSSSGTDTSFNVESDALTTGSVTIPVDGGFLAICLIETTTNGASWTNATEDLDFSEADYRYSTAMRTTNGTVTITVSASTSQPGALGWVIFQKAG